MKILPSLEHIGSVEGCASDGSDIHIFLLNSFDFVHYVFLGVLDFVELFYYLPHFLHILGLALQLAHHVADVLLHLLTLQLDRVLDELDDAFDVEVEQVAQVLFEDCVVDHETMDLVIALHVFHLQLAFL